MRSIRFHTIFFVALIAFSIHVSASCEGTGWLDEKNKFCCNGQIIDITKETCCNDKPYIGTNWIICGDNCIQEESSMKCCNGKIFDNNAESCCNDKIYSGSNWAPCGNGCYNRDAEKCCYGAIAYDNQYCEDGRIFNISTCGEIECSKGQKCCGDQTCYNPAEQACEKGVLKQICHQDVCETNEKCCWNVGCYDPTKYSCIKVSSDSIPRDAITRM